MSSITTAVAADYRLQQWAQLVKECQNRPSDMTVELAECFKSVRDSLAPQHKLYPYYETGIQEINGKHIFCMANENDSNGLKIVFTYDLVTRKVGFTYIKTL